jgi:hypothetical protein
MLEPKEKGLKIENLDFKPPHPENLQINFTMLNKRKIVSSIIKEELHNTGLNPGPFMVPGSPKGAITLGREVLEKWDFRF